MLLQRIAVSVSSVGEHVLLAMGGSSWTLHYETALALSAQMRAQGRAAKRFAGDLSRHVSLLGSLHDAEKGPDAGQPFTPGRVYPVNREALRQVSAAAEGRIVVVKLGGAEARMPYQAALSIAQWLRLRAKESKRRAGDSRHWSGVVEARP